MNGTRGRNPLLPNNLHFSLKNKYSLVALFHSSTSLSDSYTAAGNFVVGRLKCTCEISGFCHGVVEAFALLLRYTVLVVGYQILHISNCAVTLI
jgi:hypothetical protein